MNHTHTPVLVREVVGCLKIGPGMNVVDATVGAGGHAEAILKAMGGKGKLLGIDQDAAILALASRRLKPWSRRVTLVQGNFREMSRLVRSRKFGPVHAVLMDLGVSSLQFDTASRGFSFSKESMADMRMDPSTHLTAARLVNTLREEELERLFRMYGEERSSRALASAIVRERRTAPLTTTTQLAALAQRSVRGRPGLHPATRMFQALRIAVNDELGALRDGLLQAVSLLAVRGRIAVIAYHSLEDRIVKWSFRDLPGVLRIETKKPVTPGREETAVNPRSRSAKLREAEKISDHKLQITSDSRADLAVRRFSLPGCPI